RSSLDLPLKSNTNLQMISISILSYSNQKNFSEFYNRSIWIPHIARISMDTIRILEKGIPRYLASEIPCDLHAKSLPMNVIFRWKYRAILLENLWQDLVLIIANFVLFLPFVSTFQISKVAI